MTNVSTKQYRRQKIYAQFILTQFRQVYKKEIVVSATFVEPNSCQLGLQAFYELPMS